MMKAKYLAGLLVMSHTYTNAKGIFTTTSATTLYTCPAATQAIVNSILVSEDSGNADTITVTLTNGSDVYSLFESVLLQPMLRKNY